MTTIFLTGASGYIGGSVAARLVDAGYRVRGLVRNAASLKLLAERGIEPLLGTLEDAALLTGEARRADGVVNAANADDSNVVAALMAGLDGSGKPFVHTSGSSVIGDEARGDRLSDAIFDENEPFVVPPAKQARRDLELTVLGAADKGVRTIVVCPTLIYGVGRGLNPHSLQVPALVRNAFKQGRVEIIGKGLNCWSNVHIEDLADLYLLALEKAPSGAYYFAENGESSFAEMGAAIAERLGFGPVEALPNEVAIERFGSNQARFSLGGNSRVRALRARSELGWAPRRPSLISWILEEMPIDDLKRSAI